MAYQSFQALECCLPSKDLLEHCLFEYIGRHEQCTQILEDRVAEVHNWSMEVGDWLADLDTGWCHCQDVAITSPLSIMKEPPSSPSLSAVQGEGEEREGGGSDTSVENKVPLPMVVHGQRAC